jgi:hypothetical protein
VVLNCVGLTPAHLGTDTPQLSELANKGFHTPLAPALPAVTTTAQATMLTGVDPSEHGIVANGWYFRDLNEILLWRQSERLVCAPHVWEGQPWKVLKHFWWYAMNTGTAATVTPRPVYHHRGRAAQQPLCGRPPLRLMDAAFERAVLAQLLAIPPGSVSSYGVLAALAGYPRHARKLRCS